MAKNRNLNDLLFLDIYLSSLNSIDYKKIKINVLRNATRFPLISWGLLERDIKLGSKNDNLDLIVLQKMAKNFNWNADMETIINQEYDAIVVSDSSQIIHWVNEGFTTMTGYSSEFAIGKTPKFLQGNNTSEVLRKKISKRLQLGKTVTESIINYKKNKQEYLCRVQVIPIKNAQNEVTHFIAFEKEIA